MTKLSQSLHVENLGSNIILNIVDEKPAVALSPRRGGRPSPEEGRQITVRILEAATELFFSQGFEATSIDDISARAAVSKRTFYTRFSAKDELFGAVIEHRVSFHLANLSKLGDCDKGPLQNDLLEIGFELSSIALSEKAVGLERLLTRETGKFPEIAKLYHQIVVARVRSFVTDIFDRANKRGEILIDDSSFLAEQFIHAVISGPLRLFMLGIEMPLQGEELRVYVGKVVDLFINGMMRPGQSAGA